MMDLIAVGCVRVGTLSSWSRGALRGGTTGALLAACLLLSGGRAMADTLTTLYFTGQCTDCTGTGEGVLVLDDYTLGQPLENSEFVSFTYSSNLIQLSIVSGQQYGDATGLFGPSLPGAADFSIEVPIEYGSPTRLEFSSDADGSWSISDAGPPIFDYGSSSSWSLTAPAVTPEPSSVSLLGLGALAIGWPVYRQMSRERLRTV
jgi:hypothetical protein